MVKSGRTGLYQSDPSTIPAFHSSTCFHFSKAQRADGRAPPFQAPLDQSPFPESSRQHFVSLAFPRPFAGHAFSRLIFRLFSLRYRWLLSIPRASAVREMFPPFSSSFFRM